MENKMEELARLAGLELEEEFTLDNRPIKYKLTKDGFMYWTDAYQQWNYTCGVEELFLGKRRIVKIPKPILNEKEKEYLSSVIKPFRDKVSLISKRSNDNGQFISIEIEEKPHNNNMFFPYFEKGSMYKGMEINKYYTLEELDL